MIAAVKRFRAAVADLFRVPSCCPHDVDDPEDPDTAYLPADVTRHDYRGCCPHPDLTDDREETSNG